MPWDIRDIHHRRSIRLCGHDYAAMGTYFVTICTIERECLLSKIVNGKAALNAYGRCADTALLWLPKQYPFVELDAYVVMPNHLHAILRISPGGSRTAPQKSLGRLVGAFKTVSTKWMNVIRDTPGEAVWQRNYYDRIIRTDEELQNVRRYIVENPSRWSAKAGAPFANGAT